ncbi:MAG TPA: AbrB/MazE/SpoVT family DNA-binding domain-containing protein [Nocardioidaceae bacterium]|nr:AbrB/MazE/SpoVT family DNA-binding domain-containing protein [Nocardioidaceae bacterium]
MTSKGQVTIPIDVRTQLGLRPGDDVEFEVDGDVAHLKRSARSPQRGRRIVEHLRGRGDVQLSTDEIMALTRRG